MASRRRFIAAVGTAFAVGLAGCTAFDDEETPTPPPETPEDTPDEPEDTPTPEEPEVQPPGDQTGDIISVKDHGAAGDGETDDTRAIQTALNVASTGDTVFLPPGEYFVARDHHGVEPILTIPTDVTELTVRGWPGYNSTRIFMSEDEYASSRNVALFRIQGDYDVIDGLEIRDITFDGNRPDGIRADSPSSFAVQLWPSGAGGGHDILVEDCWVENFNGPALACREGGDVVFNRITSVNNAQNFGVSEEDDSTAGTDEYGIEIRNSVSKNATLVGIDHNRGGRVKLENIYSANNGNGGWKTTSQNRETRLVNCTFENENHFAALRTNISNGHELPEPPLEISVDTVAVRNPDGGGVYLSGDSLDAQNSTITGGPIEIRDCDASIDGANGGLTVHSPAGGTITELRVVGTLDGPGVWFGGDHSLEIDTLYHAGNDEGAIDTWRPGGELSIGTEYDTDPGPLETPTEDEVGAWSTTATGDGLERS